MVFFFRCGKYRFRDSCSLPAHILSLVFSFNSGSGKEKKNDMMNGKGDIVQYPISYMHIK